MTEKASTSTINKTVVESRKCPKASALSLKTVTQVRHLTTTVHATAAPVTKTITIGHIGGNPHENIDINAPHKVPTVTETVYSTTKLIAGTLTKDGTTTVFKTIDHHNTIALGGLGPQVTETVYLTTRLIPGTLTKDGTTTVIETASAAPVPIPADALNGAAAIEGDRNVLELGIPPRFRTKVHDPSVLELGVNPPMQFPKVQGSAKEDRPEVQAADNAGQEGDDASDLPIPLKDVSYEAAGSATTEEPALHTTITHTTHLNPGLDGFVGIPGASTYETTEETVEPLDDIKTITHTTHLDPGLDGFVGIPGASTYETTESNKLRKRFLYTPDYPLKHEDYLAAMVSADRAEEESELLADHPLADAKTNK